MMRKIEWLRMKKIMGAFLVVLMSVVMFAQPASVDAALYLKIYRVDDLQKVNGIWQIRCNSLVPVGFDWTDNGIGVGDVDEVYLNGDRTLDQILSKGSYFTFNTSNLISASSAMKGTGGYYWTQFNMKYSGKFWLRTSGYYELFYTTHLIY
ncbi:MULTISPECIES: lytic exoenzyme target recognition domain-containing protein [Listeria]|uniref:lytic exoenzyme target recognition domain-containing protein n=1 Tax=Listeria TaxID=1637 RepID=UPI001ABF6ECD|nr:MULTISPECIES: lytic exoenzyme target recognition domain-containing protein [Listeria]